MNILAIETSCDETAAAVVEDLPVGRQAGLKIISNVVASSAEIHKKYGGIVPEIAARRQLEYILPVIQETLTPLSNNETMQQCINENIDALAVTIGPGLIGSLLVGVETAKTIALATGKPIIPVNHVIAHTYANFVRDDQNWKSQISNLESQTIQQCNNATIEFPAVSLVASGGHTELYLMKSVKELQWLGGTLDDAAGECFDKTARLLGFENRGGPAIAAAAAKFKIQNAKFKIKLPRPMLDDDSLNFSFSGLKTAVLRELHKVTPCRSARSDLAKSTFAYELQEAITDVLIEKTLRAARKYDAKSILLSGGVAANLRLREKFSILVTRYSIHAPPARLCTDNAVYIASYAYFRGTPTDWREITATPNLRIEL